MKYIYHHLGLGDHIICNGLVRIFSNEFDEVSLFCKHHNLESVSFMYRDKDNITVIPVNDDSEVIEYIRQRNLYNDTIQVGFDNMYRTKSNNFDESFYSQFDIDFENRWSKFDLQRDLTREEKLFNELELKDTPYIFLHDDERFSIDLEKVNKELKIVRPLRNLTDNIFDYLKIIENAQEVHTIESSFLFIIDSLNLNKDINAHRYPRQQGYMETPIYKNVKKIIN